MVFFCKFVHLFALLFCPSDCDLWFTMNWIYEKSIVNTCKMSTLRVNFLAASLPRIPRYNHNFNIVKDASGSCAVFTEQGSSASQVTAAIVMDIISRLPGCSEQAADAVSAYTKVRMEDAPTLLKIPKSECPEIWIRVPKHKWPTSWSSMEDPVIPLERNLYGHPLAGLLWWKAIWENPVEIRLGESSKTWECLFVNRKKDYSYLCMWPI